MTPIKPPYLTIVARGLGFLPAQVRKPRLATPIRAAIRN